MGNTDLWFGVTCNDWTAGAQGSTLNINSIENSFYKNLTNQCQMISNEADKNKEQYSETGSIKHT